MYVAVCYSSHHIMHVAQIYPDSVFIQMYPFQCIHTNNVLSFEKVKYLHICVWDDVCDSKVTPPIKKKITVIFAGDKTHFTIEGYDI